MAAFHGRLTGAEGRRFAVVTARFNDLITARLRSGCVDALTRHGVPEDAIDEASVPGCFELPLAVRRLATSGRYDAVIALGALIRGATPHFDYIAAAATNGLARVSLESGVPVAYGVLTCDTIEQAIERAGTKAGNKGEEAALAALEMADLLSRLPCGVPADG